GRQHDGSAEALALAGAEPGPALVHETAAGLADEPVETLPAATLGAVVVEAADVFAVDGHAEGARIDAAADLAHRNAHRRGECTRSDRGGNRTRVDAHAAVELADAREQVGGQLGDLGASELFDLRIVDSFDRRHRFSGGQ